MNFIQFYFRFFISNFDFIYILSLITMISAKWILISHFTRNSNSLSCRNFHQAGFQTNCETRCKIKNSKKCEKLRRRTSQRNPWGFFSSLALERTLPTFLIFLFPISLPSARKVFLFVLYCKRKTPLHATSKLLSQWWKRIISLAKASVLERFQFRFVSWMWSDETRDSIWGQQYCITISRCFGVNFMEIIKPP